MDIPNMDAGVARILDANANRAREGLRVLEDVARFDLNDEALCARIKTARHELTGSLAGPWSKLLVGARDSESDVGRAIETESEYNRATIEDVAIAAGKRTAEALRVLEEFIKTMDADRARRFERLRYELYEIERAVAIRMSARNLFGGVKLYVLVTEALCSRPWIETAAQAIKGGADGIQLREKSLSDGELLDRTRSLVKMCRDAEVLLIVNDRPDIARLGEADGVHVGQDDLGVSDARRIVGPSRLVGLSTHTTAQARQAMALSPDYIAIGPMFKTPTKPQRHIAGPETIQSIRGETSLPIVAVGGIDEGNVAAVVQAGADSVCVCAAVVAAPDVAAAAAGIKQRVSEASEAVVGDRRGRSGD